MATIILTVEVDDDTDAANFMYVLFSGSSNDFGDYVSEHEFTLSREG